MDGVARHLVHLAGHRAGELIDESEFDCLDDKHHANKHER